MTTGLVTVKGLLTFKPSFTDSPGPHSVLPPGVSMSPAEHLKPSRWLHLAKPRWGGSDTQSCRSPLPSFKLPPPPTHWGDWRLHPDAGKVLREGSPRALKHDNKHFWRRVFAQERRVIRGGVEERGLGQPGTASGGACGQAMPRGGRGHWGQGGRQSSGPAMTPASREGGGPGKPDRDRSCRPAPSGVRLSYFLGRVTLGSLPSSVSFCFLLQRNPREEARGSQKRTRPWRGQKASREGTGAQGKPSLWRLLVSPSLPSRLPSCHIPAFLASPPNSFPFKKKMHLF